MKILFSLNVLWAILFLYLSECVAGEIRVTPSIKANESYEIGPRYIDNLQETESLLISRIIPGINITSIHKGLTIDCGYRAESIYYHKDTISPLNYISHNGDIDLDMEINPSESFLLAISGNYGAESRRYSDSESSDLNYLTNYGNAAINIKAHLSPKLTLSLSDTLLYQGEIDSSVSNSIEFLDQSESGIQTEHSAKISNKVITEIENRPNSKTNIKIKFNEELLTFPDSDEFVDTRTDSVGLDLDYAFTKSLSTNINTSYKKYSFDAYDYTFSSSEKQDPVETADFKLGITNAISRSISFNINGGAVYSSNFDSNIDWIGSASIFKDFKSSSVKFDYSRKESHSSGLTSTITINEIWSMGLDYRFSNTLDMSASGNMSKNRSKSSDIVNLTTYSGSFKSNWKPYRWAMIGFDYQHSQQWNEGITGRDILQHQFVINITVAPYKGWKLF